MRAHGVALAALTLLIAFLLPAPSRAVPPAGPASAAVAISPLSGDVRVHFRVDWTVPTRYDATIIVTNMTTSRMDDWTLAFDLFPIADRMDGVVWSVDGTRHTVSGAGPMKSIAPGGMVWFTLSAEWTGNGVLPPAVCVFNGLGCTIETVDPPPVNPQEELPVEIAWWVAWQGLTQYRAQVLIKNISDEPVDYWTMSFTLDATVISISHVSSSQNATSFNVAGKGWTRRIEPGEMVWFTLDGVHGGDDIPEPEDCEFLGFECTFLDPYALATDGEEEPPFGGYCTLPEGESPKAKPSDISLDFQFKSLWATGYTATIEIKNNATDRPMRDWKLEFDMPLGMTVTLFWNGDLTKDGTHYVVTPLLHNSCIEPGVAIEFGFEGRHNGAPVKPSMCNLDGSSCVFARFASSTATEDDPVVGGFALDPPYPNPTAARAIVPFQVTRTQRVSLTLWDLQGRLVTTVFDAVVTAGTPVEAHVDGSDLSPGAYLLRLSGQDGAATSRQLLLVR